MTAYPHEGIQSSKCMCSLHCQSSNYSVSGDIPPGKITSVLCTQNVCSVTPKCVNLVSQISIQCTHFICNNSLDNFHCIRVAV